MEVTPGIRIPIKAMAEAFQRRDREMSRAETHSTARMVLVMLRILLTLDPKAQRYLLRSPFTRLPERGRWLLGASTAIRAAL